MDEENKVEEEEVKSKRAPSPRKVSGKTPNAEDIRKANKSKYIKEVVNKLPGNVLSIKPVEVLYTTDGKLKGTVMETVYKLVVNGKSTDEPGRVKQHLMKGRKINAV